MTLARPLILALGLALGGGACSSGPRGGGGEAEGNWIEVPQLVFKSLRFRRPPGRAVDPRAIPGGIDYSPQHTPTAQMDCRPPGELFKGVPLKQLGACLESAGEATWAYRVRLEHQPFLELLEPERAPACVREKFAKIPLPREVFFLAPDPENPARAGSAAYTCHVARVPVGEDVIRSLGVRWPLKKRVVRVLLPLEKMPKTEVDARELLISWAMAGLPHGEFGILTKYVPWEICGRCLGASNMPRADSLPLPLWPEGPGSLMLEE